MSQEAGSAPMVGDAEWGRFVAHMEQLREQFKEFNSKLDNIGERLIRLEERDHTARLDALEKTVATLQKGANERVAVSRFVESAPKYVSYLALAIAIIVAVQDKIKLW